MGRTSKNEISVKLHFRLVFMEKDFLLDKATITNAIKHDRG